MGSTDESRRTSSGKADSARTAPEPRQKRAYEKPRLRRYDQIDQVKPYGPSEL